MRIAHVTISHGPLDVRVFHKQCRTLAEAGHEVHLLVPGSVPPDRDGVRFQSLPDVEPETAYFWRVWRALPQIYRQARDLAAAVYHLPDPSLIPAGLLLKWRGARVVYDAHEDRPRQARTKYSARRQPLVGLITSALWSVLERLGRASFDRFVAATPAIARKFPEDQTTTILNYPRLDEFSPEESSGVRHEDRPNEVLYAGSINPFRGVRELIEAVALLPDDLPCTLVLIGDFLRAPPGYRTALEQLPGWTRVEWLGSLSRSEVVARLKRGRIGVNLLQPRPEHVDAMGNKTFEYMAACLPVIASDFPVWRAIIGENGAGLTVDPQDPKAIATAIEFLLEHPVEADAMGRRAAELVAARYNWDSEARKLLALYEGLGLTHDRVAQERAVGAESHGVGSSRGAVASAD